MTSNDAWEDGDGTSVKPRSPFGMRILVVEDSPSARKLMQEVLLRLGATLPNLRLASTVPEALQVFTQWRPEIVFVDLELRPPPDVPAAQLAAQTSPANAPKNGAELAMRFLEREPGVKVIVCSASEPTGTVVADFVKQGKVHAMVKPVLAAKVQQAVESAVAMPAPSAGRRR